MHMATQILTRKQRGDRIAPEDIVELNPSSYFVKSQTGKSGYAVTNVGQSWVCDCPDYRFHKSNCKHIYAVLNFLDRQRLSQKLKLGLWQ
jgi:hypothetical protein